MNCANHPGTSATAFCRSCGKPLCDACKRDVMGVLYCEQCLAERLRDVHPNVPPPAPAFVSSTPIGSAPASGPHPALAGILAGFFPFGVGAVYTGQYAKGLAHLLIFTGLVWGLSSGHMGGFEPVLGIAMGFFCVYQIIDAVRSAHAIRMGQPPPDPFGFSRMFGMTDRTATPVTSTGLATAQPAGVSSTPPVPTAAVVLIGLGVLFLLQTAGLFEFNIGRLWPLFLIGFGVWLLITRSGMWSHGYDAGRLVYDRKVWSGPIWLITIGGLFLIQAFDGPGFGRTWPVLLLVVGLMRLLEHRNSPATIIAPPVTGYQPGAPVTPENPPSTEVKNG